MDLESKNVSQVISEIKNLLETEFTNITIVGETTNLSLSSSGHWYFTLSDKDASISAALFKMDALRNPLIKQIKDGEKVIVVGDINVYPKRGTFQVIVKKIVPLGVGDLKEQFEKLKRRLANEGLFDLDRKKLIPPLPKRVAIITALRGAALQDFINIYKRRSIWMDLVVLPTLVQGEDAARSIRASLHKIIKYSLDAEPAKKIDIIVLTRGGGSLEDLWAFNDEGLAWDLFNCPIPTISAVGHEVDFSIADFVCDLRAETPSAAAEVITHQQTLIKEKMRTLKGRLLSNIEIKISRVNNRLKYAHPHTILNIIWGVYNSYQKRLNRCDIQKRLNELTHLHEFYQRLDESIIDLKILLKEKLATLNHRLDKSSGLLNVLNPKNVLERGYGYVETLEGAVVASGHDLDKLPHDTQLNLCFHDGKRLIKKIE
ncbi:MAG: exodeoxyribonuclease VII large subunit [Bacteriovorax sp.]|nr:exodeoxyribonuclease VII large subunit [Bacteriovorax sp.]